MSKTIVVDIDDVLSATVDGVVEFCNDEWGMKLQAEHYSEAWAIFFNLPIPETKRRIKVMLESGAYGRMHHYGEAVPILMSLKQRYSLVAATSRKIDIKPETDAWIQRHFPDMFDAVHYTGIWDSSDIPSALNRTKAELCLALGADYLIDDQPKHCLGAAEVGVTSLLFGDYGWSNPTEGLPNGVVKVANWPEVGRYFDAQS